MSEREPAAPATASTENELKPRDSPTTPPSPEDADSNDLKSSRKREREVSLEPATPKADEPASGEATERKTPAPKKNRVKLDPTKEEDETPPPSPMTKSMELATSPPHESKVRQISRKVRGLKWDDKAAPELSQDTNEAADAHANADAAQNQDPIVVEAFQAAGDTSTDSQKNDVAPPADDSLAAAANMESDSDDQEKRLKRKLGDRLPSASVEEAPAKAGVEASKRARDDAEDDDNPRDKKRPTPPPEEREDKDAANATEGKATVASEPIAPQPKFNGFLAYAASSSPFTTAKGPSIFGSKPTPSPTPLAGTSNGAASSLSSSFGNKASSPFAIPNPNRPGSASTSAFASSSAFSSSGSSNPPNNLSTSPTGTKRSGFEAFASASSPFAAVARAKSPTAGFGLARSKSPTRRGSASSANAFKSYVGSGSQSFAAPSPPVKKQRQDSNEEGENGAKTGAGTTRNHNVLNGTSPEGSEEEGEKTGTFGDRLRNTVEDQGGSDEDEKVVVTEQEVQTGEEEEDTLFQVRGKLYALSDQNAWKERGTGLLKLNVRKSDGEGARLVMRKEAVYALLLNVTLFKGMRCTLAQDPRYVRFSCIESGATVHYNLRLSNAKVAVELIEEINANIPGDEPDEAV
ncbi:hypothetical protein DFH11DRAFT_1580239 [Phellopilus nigrolimitatus]|nr:hypothetical protein DFH11DRAFT_1580239 [Phellopilus nigrolimitatus]